MTRQQHKEVRDIIRWQRIGCITVKMSKRFNIPLLEALDLFYRSNTCRRFHDENTGNIRGEGRRRAETPAQVEPESHFPQTFSGRDLTLTHADIYTIA